MQHTFTRGPVDLIGPVPVAAQESAVQNETLGAFALDAKQQN